MTASRRALGSWGERQARLYLEAHGYTLLAANFRTRNGEIDLVTRQGSELVFIEVKTRRGGAFGGPEESISPSRAERLALVAEEYMQSSGCGPYDSESEWRIDLVCLNLDRGGKLLSIDHIPNAVEF